MTTSGITAYRLRVLWNIRTVGSQQLTAGCVGDVHRLQQQQQQQLYLQRLAA